MSILSSPSGFLPAEETAVSACFPSLEPTRAFPVDSSSYYEGLQGPPFKLILDYLPNYALITINITFLVIYKNSYAIHGSNEPLMKKIVPSEDELGWFD